MNSGAFGKTNENEVFTYHEIWLKKAITKKLHGITTEQHLNFNEYVTNKCKNASRKLNVLSRVSFPLWYQQNKVCQTLSSVYNSVIVLLFGYLLPLGLAEKSNYWELSTIMSKWLNVELWQTIEQTGLTKH